MATGCDLSQTYDIAAAGCRSLCIKCLCQLVLSYLVRLCGPGKVHGQQQVWLDRVVKPLMLAARKGGMTAAEQQVGGGLRTGTALVAAAVGELHNHALHEDRNAMLGMSGGVWV